MTPTQATSARADALFASALERSDDPTPVEVRAAVSASLRRHGVGECAARVAYEFGEHPMEAVTRMSWVLAQVRSAYQGDDAATSTLDDRRSTTYAATRLGPIR
jgi:hypothetical protein